MFLKIEFTEYANLSQISLEVDETLQLYSACLNKQNRKTETLLVQSCMVWTQPWND